jgi:AP-2 complex subunit alpha
VRSEFRGQMACVILYFSNKAPTAISSFTTTLDVAADEKAKLTYDLKGLPDATLLEGAQAQQMIMFEARAPFSRPPTIRISYLAGALQALTLAIPLTVHKFMDSAALSSEDFFRRWKQIGGAPREAQKVFGVKGSQGGRQFTPEFVRRVVEGFAWGVLDGVDPNARNLVGASVLHTSEAGKVGCLLRLEPNYETQVCFFCSAVSIPILNPLSISISIFIHLFFFSLTVFVFPILSPVQTTTPIDPGKWRAFASPRPYHNPASIP